VLRSTRISSLKIQVVGVSLTINIERELEALTTTNDSCRIETVIVEGQVVRIACPLLIGRKPLEPLKDQGQCGKGVSGQKIVAIRIDPEETAETIHDQETAAIHIDVAETIETGHDQDHQDGTGIRMTEIVGNGVLQGIWTVMKATSAEE
jgi:hypothetical protein